MGKLTQEDLDVVGKEINKMTPDELEIPDYKCNNESISELMQKIGRKANWYMQSVMNNVLTQCILLGTEEVPMSERPQASIPTRAPKKKKAPSAWQNFVKKNMSNCGTRCSTIMSSLSAPYKQFSVEQKKACKENIESCPKVV